MLIGDGVSSGHFLIKKKKMPTPKSKVKEKHRS